MDDYYCCAALDFDRSSVAVNCRNSSKAHLMWTLCQSKQKPIPARIPLILTVKQCSLYMGFFTSIAAVRAR